MSSFPTVRTLAGTASRSRVARISVFVLVILTPVLIAGVAVSALGRGVSTNSVGAPNLPAAVVNLDLPVQTIIDGKQVPVVAGKLLTTQLSSGNTSGFSWTITDSASAAEGLAGGAYTAVVTIPSNFSAAYASSSGDNPVQAALSVQTNGASSYVAELLASALVTNVQTALATDLTQNFVKGLLGGFTDLHTQLGAVGQGAQLLAGGASQLAEGVQQSADGTALLTNGAQQLSGGLHEIVNLTAPLPKLTSDLALGAKIASDGTDLLLTGLDDLALEEADVELRQGVLDLEFDSLVAEIPHLSSAEITARVTSLKEQAAEIAAISTRVGDGLDVAVAGTALLTIDADLVSKGATALSDGMPALNSGISASAAGAAQLVSGTSDLNVASAELASGASQLSSGTSQLAVGLTQAAAAIPTYTDAQQTTLSTVVSSPIVTTRTDSGKLPSATAAIAAVMVPVALWIGAFAAYFLLAPFTAQALGSTASVWRIARRSMIRPLGLGAVQALMVLLVLGLTGTLSGPRVGSVFFVFAVSFAFVLFHQGLIGLLGRVGQIISLALVSLQVVAAGIIIPVAMSPAGYQALSPILPISSAIRGMQTLVAGGDLSAVIGASITLVIIAGIGVVLTVVAISRRRTFVC